MCNYPPYLDRPKPAEDWRKDVFAAADELYRLVTGRSISDEDRKKFFEKYDEKGLKK